MIPLRTYKEEMTASQENKGRFFLKNVAFELFCEGRWNLALREQRTEMGGFPGGAVVKNPPANAGDTGLSPGPGRSHMPQNN